MVDTPQNGNDFGEAEVQGELTTRLGWMPIRVLAVVTGLFLIRGIWVILARYSLGLRRRATVTLKGNEIILLSEWSILGRGFLKNRTITAVENVEAAYIESRQRYLYLLFGWGGLAIGTWVGIQWFVDGLRAGYPYLALVGAAVVAAGVVIDLGMYLLVPMGAGHSRLVLAIGPFKARICGVVYSDAEHFLDAMGHRFTRRRRKKEPLLSSKAKRA